MARPVLFAVLVAACMAGCGCSRSPAPSWGKDAGWARAAAAGSSATTAAGGDTLRLRGGWCRGKTKQRVRRMVYGKKVAKAMKSGTETIRPCSGPLKKSQIERFHGTAMVGSVLRAATPRSFVFDPRTAMLRHGMRMNKHDVPIDAPFNKLQKGDVNSTLIKVCHRGKYELIEDLVAAGADINYVGMKGSHVPGYLIGYSPLSAAAHSGRTDTVRTLIQLGADIRGGSKFPPYFGWDFWVELANTQAKRRQEMEKAQLTKTAPIYGRGNGRRDPGKRKTRHAIGARGGNR